MHTSVDSLLNSLSLQPSQSNVSAWFSCSDIPALKTRIELATCNYLKPSMASTVSMIVYRCIHNECCGTISFQIYASSQPYDSMVKLNYDHPVEHHDNPRRPIQPSPVSSAPPPDPPVMVQEPLAQAQEPQEVIQVAIEPQTPMNDNMAPMAGTKLCTRCQRFEVSITHKTCVRGTGCRINERRRVPLRPNGKKADAIDAVPHFTIDDPDGLRLPPPTAPSSSPGTSTAQREPFKQAEQEILPIAPKDDESIAPSFPATTGPTQTKSSTVGSTPVLESKVLHQQDQIPRHPIGSLVAASHTRPIPRDSHLEPPLTEKPLRAVRAAVLVEAVPSSPRLSTPDLINEYLADDVSAFSSPLTTASSSPAATPPPDIILDQNMPEVWDPSLDHDLVGTRTCGGTKCTVQVPANGRFKKCDDCREKFRLYQIARRQKQKKPSPKLKHSDLSIHDDGNLDVSEDIFLEMLELEPPLLRTKRKHSEFADDSDDNEHASQRIRLTGDDDFSDEYLEADENETDGDWQE